MNRSYVVMPPDMGESDRWADPRQPEWGILDMRTEDTEAVAYSEEFGQRIVDLLNAEIAGKSGPS